VDSIVSWFVFVYHWVSVQPVYFIVYELDPTTSDPCPAMLHLLLRVRALCRMPCVGINRALVLIVRSLDSVHDSLRWTLQK